LGLLKKDNGDVKGTGPRKNNRDECVNTIDTIKDTLNTVVSVQRAHDIAMTSLTVDVNKKFDYLMGMMCDMKNSGNSKRKSRVKSNITSNKKDLLRDQLQKNRDSKIQVKKDYFVDQNAK
jgi:hypothetical protein